MNLPIVLKPAAERDIESAAAWHEDWNGSALRFVAQVREVLDRIGQRAESTPSSIVTSGGRGCPDRPTTLITP